MRLWMIALVAAAVGCHSQHEATNGEEFYRKFEYALRHKDVDTLWRMMSEGCRADMARNAEARIRLADSTEQFNELLGDDVDPQPVPAVPTRNPDELAQYMLGEWIERNRDLVYRIRYVETIQTPTPLGEMTSVVFRYPGVDRDLMILMEVDGYLRMWSCDRFLTLDPMGKSIARAEE